MILDDYHGRPLRVEASSSPTTLGWGSRYIDEIESLVVKKGCSLDVYRDRSCRGPKYTFRAENTQDLLIHELERSHGDDFGE